MEYDGSYLHSNSHFCESFNMPSRTTHFEITPIRLKYICNNSSIKWDSKFKTPSNFIHDTNLSQSQSNIDEDLWNLSPIFFNPEKSPKLLHSTPLIKNTQPIKPKTLSTPLDVRNLGQYHTMQTDIKKIRSFYESSSSDMGIKIVFDLMEFVFSSNLYINILTHYLVSQALECKISLSSISLNSLVLTLAQINKHYSKSKVIAIYNKHPIYIEDTSLLEHINKIGANGDMELGIIPKRQKLCKLPSSRTSTPFPEDHNAMLESFSGDREDSSGIFSLSKMTPTFCDQTFSINAKSESRGKAKINKILNEEQFLERDLALCDLSSLFSSPFACSMRQSEDKAVKQMSNMEDILGNCELESLFATSPFSQNAFSPSSRPKIQLNSQENIVFHKTQGESLNGIKPETVVKSPAKISCKRTLFSPDKLKARLEAFNGFKTAAGQAVTISDDCVKKARTLLLSQSIATLYEEKPIDWDGGNCKFYPETNAVVTFNADRTSFTTTKDSLSNSKQPATSAFFKTASGDDIVVKERNLLSAKKLLDPLEFQGESLDLLELKMMESNEGRDKMALKPSPRHKVPLVCPFMSAAGKQVIISEESLNKAKVFMGSQLNISQKLVTKENKPVKIKNAYLSALEDNVKVLAKEPASTMIHDDNEFIKNDSYRNKNKPMTCGFQSAAGKEVTIAEESLIKAKELMGSSHLDNTQKLILTEGLGQNIGNQTKLGKIEEQALSNVRNDKINEVTFKKEFETQSCSSLKAAPKYKPKFGHGGKNIEQNQQAKNGLPRPHDKAKESTGIENKSCKMLGHLYNLKYVSSGLKRISLARVDKLENYLKRRKAFKIAPSLQSNDAYGVMTSKDAQDFKVDLRRHQYLKFMPKECSSSGNGNALQRFWLTKDGSKIPIPSTLTPNVAGRDWYLDKEKICQIFLKTPGVDENLMPKPAQAWVCNHYRWIVWKLAAMEHRFPLSLGCRLLTPHNVLSQLKLRYDREMEKCERSCMQKITERDDTPGKTMILLVSDILEQTKPNAINDSKPENIVGPQNNSHVLELSDGWYSLRCHIDEALCNLVRHAKIMIGDKLCVSQAKLIGSMEAYTPLEAYEHVALSINANSTRRAKWDTKLGYLIGHPRPISVTLDSLLPHGGNAPRLDLVVVKTYPLLYMVKYDNGSITMLTEKAYESKQTQSLEDALTASPELLKDHGGEISPKKNITEYANKIVRKNQISSITPVFKVRVADLKDLTESHAMNRTYQVTIYKPSEDMTGPCANFKFGSVVVAFNLGVSAANNFQQPNNSHDKSHRVPIQLKTCSKSVFEKHPHYGSDSKCKEFAEIVQTGIYDPIQYDSLLKTKSSSNIDSIWREIDVIGYVIHISNIPNEFRFSKSFSAPNQGDQMYATYVYLLCPGDHILSLKFNRDQFEEFGYKNMLRMDCLAACSNLLYCHSTKISRYSQSFITFANATNLSTFSKLPKPIYLQAEINTFQRWIVDNHESAAAFLVQGKKMLSVYMKANHNLSFENRNFKDSLVDVSDHSESTADVQLNITRNPTRPQKFQPAQTSTPFDNRGTKGRVALKEKTSSTNDTTNANDKLSFINNSFFKYDKSICDDFAHLKGSKQQVDSFGQKRNIHREFKPPRKIIKL